MTMKIDNFDVPVCNAFQAKVLNDQLCYEVDLNTLRDQNNIEKDLKIGFNFIMDYNEDRQVIVKHNTEERNAEGKRRGIANNLLSLDENKHALIYLNSIG